MLSSRTPNAIRDDSDQTGCFSLAMLLFKIARIDIEDGDIELLVPLSAKGKVLPRARILKNHEVLEPA